MTRRPNNLLICFDAFGTLFRPTIPVESQYALVARSHGLKGFSDDEVKSSFRVAYKNESKLNPNYGKLSGLNAEIWWTNVINNTFRPLVGEQPITKDLVRALLHRFWCNEGYTLFPDVIPLVRRLRAVQKEKSSRLLVGVITNSDDRIPAILTSLGVSVSPWRYASETKAPSQEIMSQYDIDFTVISYDVGHEKPDRRIFEAAEQMLHQHIAATHSEAEADSDVESWRKVYVGDEYAKDVVGAYGAGWQAVLIDRGAGDKHEDITWLDDQPSGSLYGVTGQKRGVGFESLASLAPWLP